MFFTCDFVQFFFVDFSSLCCKFGNYGLLVFMPTRIKIKHFIPFGSAAQPRGCCLGDWVLSSWSNWTVIYVCCGVTKWIFILLFIAMVPDWFRTEHSLREDIYVLQYKKVPLEVIVSKGWLTFYCRSDVLSLTCVFVFFAIKCFHICWLPTIKYI